MPKLNEDKKFYLTSNRAMSKIPVIVGEASSMIVFSLLSKMARHRNRARSFTDKANSSSD